MRLLNQFLYKADAMYAYRYSGFSKISKYIPLYYRVYRNIADSYDYRRRSGTNNTCK